MAETRTVLIPFFYSLQDPTRYICRSLHAVKFLLEVPASRVILCVYTLNAAVQRASRVPILRWGSTINNTLSSCAVRTTSWNSEPTGSVWTDRAETLLGGGGHPKATTFPGGPWDMRLPETAAPWSTRGGRVGRMFHWGHQREKDTVKRGVDRSLTASLTWALRRQDFFPAAFIKLIIKVLRPVLHFEGCGWARFPCPYYLGGGARKATLCLDVWAAPAQQPRRYEYGGAGVYGMQLLLV